MAVALDGETPIVDPYHSKQRFTNHLDKRITKFQEKEQPIVKEYLIDMRTGRNTHGKNAKRGYIHLNTLCSRLTKISGYLKQYHKTNLVDCTADQLHALFDSMEQGKILKSIGKRYKSTHDYIKIYKAFWNWYSKTERRKGKQELPNKTIDLNGESNVKPDFVFFNKNSLQRLLAHCKYEYKALFYFLFDTGMRVTEMLNIRRRDVKDQEGAWTVNIRSETSKTFGRKIKLMLCKDLLKDYLNYKQIGVDEYLFRINPRVVNQYLDRLGTKVFGENLRLLTEHEKDKTKITLYDFRHSSACYWVPIYKSESSLKYRFGWKKSEMIHYYTEFLGMKDTIDEEDLYVDVTKTELEKALDDQKRQTEILKEQLSSVQDRLALFDKLAPLIDISKSKASELRAKI